MRLLLFLHIAFQFLDESNIKRCGNLLLYPIDGASRIALVPDKAIDHTIRICKEPIMAVQTNDAVLLLPSSCQVKFCENSIFEDNFNNTFYSKKQFILPLQS